jgi:hypothetical protein
VPSHVALTSALTSAAKPRRASLVQAEAVQADDGRVNAKVRRSQAVISEEARVAIRRREAAAAAAAPLREDELTAARRVLLRYLQPRESVMEALQRLSGRPRAVRLPLRAATRNCGADTARPPRPGMSRCQVVHRRCSRGDVCSGYLLHSFP